MFIARWQFTTRFGKTNDAIEILRKWEVEVGQRAGWRPGSVRILSGLIGGPESEVELETRFDNLADLEAAWGDMERAPAQKEYMKMLEGVVVAGSNRWMVYRETNILKSAD